MMDLAMFSGGIDYEKAAMTITLCAYGVHAVTIGFRHRAKLYTLSSFYGLPAD